MTTGFPIGTLGNDRKGDLLDFINLMRIDYLAAHRNFIPILSQWHHEQWSYLNPSRTVKDRIEEFQQEKGLKQIPTTFVAMSENVLLGSASLIVHDMDTRKDLSPWLASVYVAPRHRQQGIGSALVQRTVEEAKELEVGTLYLFTPDREKFYKRLGWSVLEVTEYRGENNVIMALRLTSDEKKSDPKGAGIGISPEGMIK